MKLLLNNYNQGEGDETTIKSVQSCEDDETTIKSVQSCEDVTAPPFFKGRRGGIFSEIAPIQTDHPDLNPAY